MVVNICCFSGYRPEKFPFHFDNDKEEYELLRSQLAQAIISAVGDGYDTFLCGMAKGFDLMAGEVVLELVQACPDMAGVKLVAVLPFVGHGFAAGRWQSVHRLVSEQASEVITLEGGYRSKAYLERNRYMVDRSNRVICYHTGLPGGTAHTLRLACEKGIEIVNLGVLNGG